MRGVLLDTNVISASSPLRAGDGDEALRAWLVERSAHLFLPAVAIGEIRAGVEAARGKNQTAKAERLERWSTQLVVFFEGRILPVDTRVADLSGTLFALARAGGSDPGWIDAQIAAIAKANDLLLLTRNVRHFAPMRIDFRNPFVETPGALDALIGA